MSRQFWQETLFWATADATPVANTTTETVIFPDFTIPANYMADGRGLELHLQGKFSTTTGPPTLRFRLRWGGVAGTLLADSGTITTIASVTNAAFWIRMLIQTRANGSTGSLFAFGDVNLYGAVAPTVGSATGAPGTAVMTAGGVTAPAAVTANLTADTALSITVAWSAASASNTLTGMQYLLKSLN